MDKTFPWLTALIFSLIIHMILVSSTMLLRTEKEVKEKPPLIANLITPAELEGLRSSVPPVYSGAQEARTRRGLPNKNTLKMPSSPVLRRSFQGSEHKASAGDDSKSITQQTGKEATGESVSADQRSGVLSQGKALPGGSGLSTRQRLFAAEKEAAEVIAKKEETGKDNGITFDTKELRYHGYMSKLQSRIEGIWKYPHEAASRGIYGDLRIKFTIKKDGMLGNVELSRTSGHRSLDEAAMQALKDAEPFWPLPEEWGREGITIDGHFVYTIHGVYIR